MEKINRFRETQIISLDDFLNSIIKNPNCKYCTYHDECQSSMGVTSIEDDLGGFGCAAFDNTVDNLLKLFKRDFKYTT